MLNFFVKSNIFLLGLNASLVMETLVLTFLFTFSFIYCFSITIICVSTILVNQIIKCLNQIICENKPYNLRLCTFTLHKFLEKILNLNRDSNSDWRSAIELSSFLFQFTFKLSSWNDLFSIVYLLKFWKHSHLLRFHPHLACN